MRVSRFTEHLARANSLRFRRWLFEDGMRFAADAAWWGGRARRGRPHNGLDLRWYEDADGARMAIGAGTVVPAVFAGRVVACFPDFLGATLVVAHEIGGADALLHTMYGHVVPSPGTDPGASVGEGGAVAAVADAPRGRVPPHLHLSGAFIPRSIPPARFSWRLFGEEAAVRFVDPEPLLGASA